MSNILYGTIYITEDEPCMGLFELNLQSPGSKGVRRYQIIQVMRDDKPAEYREDMGLAADCKADQLRILGGVMIDGRFYIEETVGRLRQIANQLRGANNLNQQELAGVYQK